MALGSGKGLQKQRDSFYCSCSTADPTGSVLSSGREALSNLSPWSHGHTKPSPLAEGDAATAAPRQFPPWGQTPALEAAAAAVSPRRQAVLPLTPPKTGAGCPPPQAPLPEPAVPRVPLRGVRGMDPAEASCPAGGASPPAHTSLSHAKHADSWQG